MSLFHSLLSSGSRPNYGSLSNIELLVDFTGLVVGTTNDYGTVDGSGNITTLKSLAPGPTGRDFTSGGTAPTLSGGAGVFGGAGYFTNTVKATWNFLHFNATLANLKHTIHFVAKLANALNPNSFLGILGNTGGSSASKGIHLFYDDRVAFNFKDGFQFGIVRGTSTQFISSVTEGNTALTNRWAVYTFETDISNPTETKLKIYVNGDLIGYLINYVNNTSPQTTSTHDLQIGAGGNNVAPLVGSIKELVIQSRVESAGIRSAFIQGLISKHQISTTNDQVFSVFQRLSESRYYLSTVLDQNPTDSNTILCVFTDGVDHVYESGKKLSLMKSTDKGLTFASKVTVYDPVNPSAIQDLAGGYDSNGKFHLFTPIITSGSAGSLAGHKLIYMHSTDNGSNWTTVDLTSIMPGAGVDISFPIAKMIENNGVLMATFYTQDDQGDTNPSAIYVLRSTDYGANWSVVNVKPSDATYRNESTLIACSSTHLKLIARDEVTSEWHQYASTDNGLTWASDGALTFGETMTLAGPASLEKFQINGQDVIVCYYPDRAVNILKAVYATPANLISSGVSGWNLDTKTTIKRLNQSGTYHLHYGSVCHYDNDFNAIGAYPYDPYPTSGAGVVNEMWFFKVPTWHYSTVKTALGL